MSISWGYKSALKKLLQVKSLLTQKRHCGRCFGTEVTKNKYYIKTTNNTTGIKGLLAVQRV